MRYLHTNELFRINIPGAGDVPSLSVTWNNHANILFLPVPVEGWTSWEWKVSGRHTPSPPPWEMCQCEGVSIHGYSGTLLLHGWRCIYDFIHAMGMYLVTCSRRACEPPGNLDISSWASWVVVWPYLVRSFRSSLWKLNCRVLILHSHWAILYTFCERRH